jgi:hypothetical protein
VRNGISTPICEAILVMLTGNWQQKKEVSILSREGRSKRWGKEKEGREKRPQHKVFTFCPLPFYLSSFLSNPPLPIPLFSLHPKSTGQTWHFHFLGSVWEERQVAGWSQHRGRYSCQPERCCIVWCSQTLGVQSVQGPAGDLTQPCGEGNIEVTHRF